MFITKNDRVYDTVNQKYIDTMGILIDIETGTVIKNMEYKDLQDYWAITIQAFGNFVPAKTFILIKLEHGLSPQEICTFTNYIRNSLAPEQAKAMLDLLDKPAIHEKLRQLRGLGF